MIVDWSFILSLLFSSSEKKHNFTPALSIDPWSSRRVKELGEEKQLPVDERWHTEIKRTGFCAFNL